MHIGYIYGKGGRLEVVGDCYDTYKGGEKSFFFLVKCNECSKDSELFGEGIFRITRAGLKTGKEPCGCTRKYAWSKEQLIILAQREAIKIGYKVHGVLGKSTKSCLMLECTTCEFCWKTTCFSNFMIRKRGCPLCADRDKTQAKIKDISHFIRKLPEKEKYEITRIGDGNFLVECNKCSVDELSHIKNKFIVYKDTFARGNAGCRCSSRYRYSQEEAEFLLKKKFGSSFIGWKGEYLGSTVTKAIVACDLHGYVMNYVEALINNANFCRKCHPYGYDKSKPANVYVLLCETLVGDSFTGYGITNNLKGRLSAHRSNLNKFGYMIVQSYVAKTSGTLAPEIESKIKANFDRSGVEIEGFKHESTHAYNYKFVIDFIEKFTKSN